MPRWYRREKPDYSHLHGRPLNIILTAPSRTGPTGGRPDVRGDRERRPHEMVRRPGGPHGLRGSRHHGAHPRHAWVVRGVRLRLVGTRIGWGMHLGLLEEAPASDGERAWTMPDREPQFDVHRGKARRIRGLPPAEQIAMDRRRAREAKLRATLDAKHARQVAPRVVDLLNRITGSEPDAVMPAGWAPFVGADIMERWPTVAEAHGLLVDLHHGMNRERQKEWLRHLEAAADAASFAASRREGERQAAAALSEDADAFAGSDAGTGTATTLTTVLEPRCLVANIQGESFDDRDLRDHRLHRRLARPLGRAELGPGGRRPRPSAVPGRCPVGAGVPGPLRRARLLRADASGRRRPGRARMRAARSSRSSHAPAASAWRQERDGTTTRDSSQARKTPRKLGVGHRGEPYAWYREGRVGTDGIERGGVWVIMHQRRQVASTGIALAKARSAKRTKPAS